MSEEKAIGIVSEPGTRGSIAADLRRLGVSEGMVLLVHSSLSRMGWVNGGPVAVIQALMDVLTEKGTLVMPAHSSEYSDPACWENPPIPKAWHETVRQTMPVFDRRYTPTREMGRIAEVFRSWPGTARSGHPQFSFSAWGQYAARVTDDHRLAYGLGERSPLARVYDLGGWILLLGVGYDSNTSFHLAEYRVPEPPLKKAGAPWIEAGEKTWREFEDIEFNDDVFPAIGQALEGRGMVKKGKIAAADSRLMAQPLAVDFAEQWLKERKGIGQGQLDDDLS